MPTLRSAICSAILRPITVTSGPNGMTAIARIAGASENIGAIW